MAARLPASPHPLLCELGTRVTRLWNDRGDQLALAAVVLLVVALSTAGIAAMILWRTPTNARGGMVGNCFSAWEVLIGSPSVEFDAGQEPPTTWSKPCRVHAHELWLQARPWVATGVVAMVAATFAWWERQRLRKHRLRMAPLADGSTVESDEAWPG